jgi:hypothetical protein
MYTCRKNAVDPAKKYAKKHSENLKLKTKMQTSEILHPILTYFSATPTKLFR